MTFSFPPDFVKAIERYIAQARKKRKDVLSTPVSTRTSKRKAISDLEDLDSQLMVSSISMISHPLNVHKSVFKV